MNSLGTIKNRAGEALDYTTAGYLSPDRLLTVIGHGVTANKDRRWAQALSEGLLEAGIASLRFSFSGNGDSEGDFRASTISKEVDDLRAVIDHLRRPRITYIGHSMGAAVGVICAVREPRITQLISLAGMVHTQNFAERKFSGLTPGKDVMWDKPECPLSQAFLDDMREIGSVVELAPKIICPWLLVHGDADTVVPLQDSRDIREKAGGSCELVEIPGADHLFSGDAEQPMVEAVVSWLRRLEQPFS